MRKLDKQVQRAIIGVVVLFGATVALVWYILENVEDPALREAWLLGASASASVLLFGYLIVVNVWMAGTNERLVRANQGLLETNQALQELAEQGQKRQKADFVIDFPSMDEHGRPIAFLDEKFIDFTIINRGWMDSAIWAAQLHSWAEGEADRPTVRKLRPYPRDGRRENDIVPSGGTMTFRAPFPDDSFVDLAKEIHHKLVISPANGDTVKREFA